MAGRFAHLNDAELQAQFRACQAEQERRQREEVRDARLRRLESIASDLQAGLPASNIKLERKVERVARTAREAAEVAQMAFNGRMIVARDLKIESSERRADRDRLQTRVTNLEMQAISRNRQNPQA